MSRITKTFAVLVVALWGLATAHCELEQVPGFEFLTCCHEQQGTAQQHSCDGDACSVVEAGLYKAPEPACALPAPVWVVSFVLPVWEPIPPATVVATQFSRLNEFLPELPRVWQFSYRTALPPRAPSSIA